MWQDPNEEESAPMSPLSSPHSWPSSPHSPAADTAMPPTRTIRPAHADTVKFSTGIQDWTQENVGYTETIEAERELKEFLRAACPDWSLFTRSRGVAIGAPIDKVVAKLQDIGVRDIRELVYRLRMDTLNMDLTEKGHTHFSDATLAALREKAAFLRRLDSLGQPYYRQVGLFAHVPQLLAKTNRWVEGNKKVSNFNGLTGDSTHRRRPNTAPDGKAQHRGGGSSSSKSGAPTMSFRKTSFAEVRPQSAVGPLAGRPGKTAYLTNVGEAREVDDGRAHGELARRTLRYANLRAQSTPSREECRLAFAMNRAEAAAARARSSQGRRKSCSKAVPADRQGRQHLSSTGGVASLNHSSASDTSLSLRHASKGPSLQSRAICEVDSELPGGLGQEQLETASSVGTGASTLVQAEQFAQAWHANARSTDRVAKWTTSTVNNLVERAEALLEEGQALDEKEYLMKNIKFEGEGSATRAVISSNIRARLKEEDARFEKCNGDAVNQSTSIRNYLTSMQAARRELQDVRRKAGKILQLEEPRDDLAFLRENLHHE